MLFMLTHPVRLGVLYTQVGYMRDLPFKIRFKVW